MEDKSKTNIWRYIIHVGIFLIGLAALMLALDISFLRAFFTALGFACIFMAGINVLMFLMEDIGKNG